MILKGNDNICNGNSWHLHDPRELACWNHEQRQCSSLCSMSTVLFTLNSFHKAKQSTKLIMWKYWSSYVKLCMAMFQLRRSSVSGQAVSDPETDYSTGTPTLFPDLAVNNFWLFPKIKSAFEGMKISVYWRCPKNCDDGAESYSPMGVPKMFPTVAALLD